MAGFLVHDNTLAGNNVFRKDMLESNICWNDDGIRLPGRGHAVFNNTLSGFGDSLALAKRLVTEAGLGLAPGNAFAPEAQGWLRWCFASKDVERLRQGVGRLQGWLAGRA